MAAALWLWGVGFLTVVVSPVVEQGSRALGLRLLGHTGSGVVLRALEHKTNCGTRAQWLCGMWDLPESGIESVSPALDSLPLSHVQAPNLHSFKPLKVRQTLVP